MTNETYDSNRVHVEVQRHGNCRVTLTVKAQAAVAQDAKKNAIREIAKEVSIPGFRKGKAPAAMIEKKFHSALIQKWEAAFADICFSEGQTLGQVPVLNGNSKINFKVHSLTLDGGEVSYQFEAEPKVPEISPKDYKLPEIEEQPVDNAMIEDTLKNIRMFYAKWEQVKDRPVREGDFVVLDIDDISQDPPVQAFSNTRFEVVEKKMAAWMRDLVLGKNVGDTFEGESRPDAHESEEVKKEFKPKKVKIHLKEIEEAVMPPLDDEFAVKLGVQSMDELKEKLHLLLTKREKENLKTKLREAIADQIVEKCHFEVPGSILEQEANHRMNRKLKQGDFARRWNEEMSEEEKNKVKEEIKKQADEALRLFYVARRIASENHISISEEELSPSFGNLLEMMFADPARINFKNQSKEQQGVEYSKLMMAKTQDWLIDKLAHA